MTLRSLTYALSAITISLLIGIGTIEAAVRLIADDGMQYELEMWKYALQVKRVSDNAAIGHEHVPGATALLMGAMVETNDQGLRDDPAVLPKPDDVFRIVMLGDSITFGWGVEKQDRFSEKLERALADIPELQGRRLEIINTGVGNYNSVMSVAWYLQHGRAYGADMILLNHFINDAEPTPSRQGGWLREHSAAYVYFAGKVDTALRLFEERKDWRDYYRALYQPDTPGFAAMLTAFDDLSRVADEDGIPVVMTLIPELRILAPYPFTDINDTLQSLATDRGWRSIDLLPSVVDAPPESLWVTVPDPHPNDRANAFFASYLADPLRQAIAGATRDKSP